MAVVGGRILTCDMTIYISGWRKDVVNPPALGVWTALCHYSLSDVHNSNEIFVSYFCFIVQ